MLQTNVLKRFGVFSNIQSCIHGLLLQCFNYNVVLGFGIIQFRHSLLLQRAHRHIMNSCKGQKGLRVKKVQVPWERTGSTLNIQEMLSGYWRCENAVDELVDAVCIKNERQKAAWNLWGLSNSIQLECDAEKRENKNSRLEEEVEIRSSRALDAS